MENLIFVDDADCCVYSTQATDVYRQYYEFFPNEWENEGVIKNANIPKKSILVSKDDIAEKDCTISEIRELLKFHSCSYSEWALLKYLTSFFFKEKLDHYMKEKVVIHKQDNSLVKKLFKLD